MTSSTYLEPSVSSFVSSFNRKDFIAVLRVGILAGGTAISWMLYKGQLLLSRQSGDAATKGPLPIIFTGMLGAAIVESIGLVYEIAKRCLGDREFFENFPADDINLLINLNKWRFHAWRGIFWLEKHVSVIDTIYSRIFNIRTGQELQDFTIPEKEWKFMEIFRSAFNMQVQETMNKPYPTNGYTILLVNFTLGVSDKINQILNRIQIERIEEKNQDLHFKICS
jgi:hypothetical protein